LTSLGFNFDVIEDGLRESYAAERYVKDHKKGNSPR